MVVVDGFCIWGFEKGRVMGGGRGIGFSPFIPFPSSLSLSYFFPLSLHHFPYFLTLFSLLPFLFSLLKRQEGMRESISGKVIHLVKMGIFGRVLISYTFCHNLEGLFCTLHKQTWIKI